MVEQGGVTEHDGKGAEAGAGSCDAQRVRGQRTTVMRLPFIIQMGLGGSVGFLHYHPSGVFKGGSNIAQRRWKKIKQTQQFLSIHNNLFFKGL